MKQSQMHITENSRIARDVYRMRLAGDCTGITQPGQFVNLQLDGCFLRRPISVSDWSDDSLTLIYKTVGKGTEQMSRMLPGESLNILTGLGNGYTLSRAGDHPLLIGGGVGVPPLYGLAKSLRKQGKPVTAVLGFNTGADVFAETDFRDLGCNTILATADGSLGWKGFVTDVLPEKYSYYYACGPLPMLKAVHYRCNTRGQLSFEERMGCGFGACMGCSCKTLTGYKRICKEGPVLEKEEIRWES